MLEQIKLAILVVGALIDTMPQESVDANGAKVKVPDDVYADLIADGVIGMVIGAGFQFGGFEPEQLRGAVKGLCPVVVRYKAAIRVVV